LEFPISISEKLKMQCIESKVGWGFAQTPLKESLHSLPRFSYMDFCRPLGGAERDGGEHEGRVEKRRRRREELGRV